MEKVKEKLAAMKERRRVTEAVSSGLLADDDSNDDLESWLQKSRDIAQSSGSGIRNMKERLQSHGGDLLIGGARKNGLSLVANIPLDVKREAA